MTKRGKGGRASRRIKTDTGAGRQKHRDGTSRRPVRGAPDRLPSGGNRGRAGAAPAPGDVVPDDAPKTVWLRIARSSDHPWIWKRMIRRVGGDVKNGDEVTVVTSDGRRAGKAMYSVRSEIALRVLTDDVADRFNVKFFERKIGAALALRTETLRLPAVTDAFRVVHGEADGLSGLVIDKFGDRFLVAEIHGLGMWLRCGEIEQACKNLLPGHRMIVRADRRAGEIEGFGHKVGPPRDEKLPEAVAFHERGLTLYADLRSGQKTGAFLDQRENRRAFTKFTDGARVLDAFCHVGGFGISAAARGGARHVTGVDVDPDAIALAKKAIAENSIPEGKVDLVNRDVFDYLRSLPRKAAFDAMVLDPPKLAHDRTELGAANRKVFDLHRLAIPRLAANGVLLSCNCTGLVQPGEYLATIAAAARAVDHEVRVIETRGASSDHPVLASCPETHYLTAILAVVRPKG